MADQVLFDAHHEPRLQVLSQGQDAGACGQRRDQGHIARRERRVAPRLTDPLNRMTAPEANRPVRAGGVLAPDDRVAAGEAGK